MTFKVRPNQSQTKITGTSNGVICADLAAPPEKGKANQELIALVAKEYGVAKSSIEFLTGETAKIKRLKIWKESDAQ